MAADEVRLFVDRLVALVPLARWLVVAAAVVLLLPVATASWAPVIVQRWAPEVERPRMVPYATSHEVDQAVLAEATRLVLSGEAGEAFISTWPVGRPQSPMILQPVSGNGPQADVSLGTDDLVISVRAIITDLLALSVGAVGLLSAVGALLGVVGASAARLGPRLALVMGGLLLAPTLWPLVDPAWTYDRMEPWPRWAEIVFVAGFGALPLQVAAEVGWVQPPAERFLDHLRGSTVWARAAQRGVVGAVRRLLHLAPMLVAAGMFVLARQSYALSKAGGEVGAAGAFLVGTLEAGASELGPLRLLSLAIAWCGAVFLVRGLLVDLERALVPARGGLQR